MLCMSIHNSGELVLHFLTIVFKCGFVSYEISFKREYRGLWIVLPLSRGKATRESLGKIQSTLYTF